MKWFVACGGFFLLGAGLLVYRHMSLVKTGVKPGSAPRVMPNVPPAAASLPKGLPEVRTLKSLEMGQTAAAAKSIRADQQSANSSSHDLVRQAVITSNSPERVSKSTQPAVVSNSDRKTEESAKTTKEQDLKRRCERLAAFLRGGVTVKNEYFLGCPEEVKLLQEKQAAAESSKSSAGAEAVRELGVGMALKMSVCQKIYEEQGIPAWDCPIPEEFGTRQPELAKAIECARWLSLAKGKRPSGCTSSLPAGMEAQVLKALGRGNLGCARYLAVYGKPAPGCPQPAGRAKSLREILELQRLQREADASPRIK